jgi:RNA polymerase sigma-B factor
MSLSSGQTTGTHREQLIESHLPLVRSIARRYAGRGESVDDLVQVGALGLIRASDRFDPDRGVTFATFATPAIEGEIRRHLGDRANSLRIPRELQRRTRQLGSARARLRVTLGRPPTVPELAEALGEEVEEVERTLEAERARQPASTSAEGVELEQPTSSATSEDRLLLVRGAQALDERERRIVLLRFHRDLTEQQIADELGISQAHVSRLLSRALAKLREALSEDEPGAPAMTVSPELPELAEPAAASRPRSKRKSASGSSGRFLVRMPGALHEQLSQAAEREHVSLNRLITQTLTESLLDEDEGAGDENEPAGPVATPAGQRRFRLLLVTNLIVIGVAVVVAIALLVLAFDRGI